MKETPWEVVSTYTRQEAIDDGTLVQLLPEVQRQFGLRLPTVITSALHQTLLAAGDDAYLGRLTSLLVTYGQVARAARPGEWFLSFSVRLGDEDVKLFAVVDGDGLTLMHPEDY